MKKPPTILAVIITLTCLAVSTWAALCGKNTYLVGSSSDPQNPAEMQTFRVTGNFMVQWKTWAEPWQQLSAWGQRRTGSDLCNPVYTLRFDPNTERKAHWYGTFASFYWSTGLNSLGCGLQIWPRCCRLRIADPMFLILIAAILFIIWLILLLMGKGGFIHILLLNALGVASVEVMTRVRARLRVRADQTISEAPASDKLT